VNYQRGQNKQQDYISKEDASSPTVATEAILLSCIIDAKEGRDVAVIDIPNAFIQTRVEDEGDVNKIINAFDKAEKPKGVGTKSSTAPDDLFKVHENHKKLHLKRP
jgi:hypothetical protein